MLKLKYIFLKIKIRNSKCIRQKFYLVIFNPSLKSNTSACLLITWDCFDNWEYRESILWYLLYLPISKELISDYHFFDKYLQWRSDYHESLLRWRQIWGNTRKQGNFQCKEFRIHFSRLKSILYILTLYLSNYWYSSHSVRLVFTSIC